MLPQGQPVQVWLSPKKKKLAVTTQTDVNKFILKFLSLSFFYACFVLLAVHVHLLLSPSILGWREMMSWLRSWWLNQCIFLPPLIRRIAVFPAVALLFQHFAELCCRFFADANFFNKLWYKRSKNKCVTKILIIVQTSSGLSLHYTNYTCKYICNHWLAISDNGELTWREYATPGCDI